MSECTIFLQFLQYFTSCLSIMETDSQEDPHASSTMQNWGVETLIVETDRNVNKNCTMIPCPIPPCFSVLHEALLQFSSPDLASAAYVSPLVYCLVPPNVKGRWAKCWIYGMAIENVENQTVVSKTFIIANLFWLIADVTVEEATNLKFLWKRREVRRSGKVPRLMCPSVKEK